MRFSIPGALGLLPLGVVLIVAGVAWTTYRVRALFLGIQTASWPSTTGRITRSERMRLFIRWSPAPDNGYVRYDYWVAGHLFRGNDVGFQGWFGAGDIPPDVIPARYPKGQAVTVWYEPHRPRRAVLLPGISIGNYLSPLVGLALSVLGLLVFIVATRTA
jgi:hypothetical protein